MHAYPCFSCSMADLEEAMVCAENDKTGHVQRQQGNQDINQGA